jgi:hypothetical protein
VPKSGGRELIDAVKAAAGGESSACLRSGGSSLRGPSFYANDFFGGQVDADAVVLCFQAEPVQPSASIFNSPRKPPPVERPIRRALVKIVLAVHDRLRAGVGDFTLRLKRWKSIGTIL